ncbi:unnamed protein product [Mytilus coruscus]|uniref:Uncharacterized protein n=1 Tax=Mytilus coruscus TaxID=42192 RepID=A0A6J8B9X7_MYTCO|nr:unnamed protein product [Mytilus coruscus]
MKCCNDTPPLVIAGFIITVLAFVLHFIGYVTSYWLAWFGEYESLIGLWQRCDHIKYIYNKCTSMQDFRDQPVKFTATQVLESLALIGYIAAVVCATLHAFVVKQRSLFIAGATTNCVAGSLGLIGCIIFCTAETIALNHLHFSFAFCFIAGIGGIVAGVFFVRAWKPDDLSPYEQFNLKRSSVNYPSN